MPAFLNYQDFDAEFTKQSDGYLCHVLSSPAGEASAETIRPLIGGEIEDLLPLVGCMRSGARDLKSASEPRLTRTKITETIGTLLFESAFCNGVRECLTSCLMRLGNDETAGLRIKLRLGSTPELGNLPWEFLYHPTLKRFLAHSTRTPIIRYADIPQPIRSLRVRPPLRLLVMAYSPVGYSPIDIDEEKKRLSAALQGVQDRGLLIMDWLKDVSLPALQQRLRKEPIHILHFIGHGGWDPHVADGFLALGDSQGHCRPIYASHLGTILHDHPTLRLVFLNSCEGGRVSSTDTFAGMAGRLVHQGTPAVVSLQRRITDQAAIQLSQVFYEALGEGYSAEASLAEARKAIFASGNDIEWGTPVLYLRAK